MIVGVSGFGYTGSGAVIDLLREYVGINVLYQDEFAITYRPDGLNDLAYHLHNPVRHLAGDAAIRRFIDFAKYFFSKRNIKNENKWKKIDERTEQFINEIATVQWKGFNTFDYQQAKGNWLEFIRLQLVVRIWCRLIRKFPRFMYSYPCRNMYFVPDVNKFPDASKNYVSDVLKILGYDNEQTLVINQAFSGDDPTASFRYFNSPKAICVDKDPRDLYFLCKMELRSVATWTPTQNVDNFIAYYRSIRNSYSKILNNDDVLLIKFEDLIYNYDCVVSKIESFLGLDDVKHMFKRKYFDPNKSINNTQLFRKYPQFSKDSQKIEEELSEYVFDYSTYPQKKEFGKAF